MGQSTIHEKPVCRESNIGEIEHHVFSSSKGKSVHNLLIFGPAGTGKTMVAKWFMRKVFPENSVYVNCWEQRTRHKIMQEILHQVGYIIHGRESTSELAKKLEKLERKRVICLDESHQMETDSLYSLTTNSSGIIMISDRPFSQFKVDERFRSGLCLNEIEFKKYSVQELVKIMTRRLRDESDREFDDDALFLIAEVSSGDARIAIQTLNFAMQRAHLHDRIQLTSNDIIEATRSMGNYRNSMLLSSLNEHQKAIYDILKISKTMDSGKLYDQYSKTVKNHVVDRGYRNYVRRMED